MAAVANNPAFAKKVGISKSVGEEFMKADKTKKFGSGNTLKTKDASGNPGLSKLPTEVRNKMGYMKKGGMAKKMADGGDIDLAGYTKRGRSNLTNTGREIGPSQLRMKGRGNFLTDAEEKAQNKQKAEDKGMKKGGMAYKEGGMHKMPNGKMMKDSDMTQDKKTAKKAVGMHEKQLHGGKKSNLAALKKGGMAKCAKGGGIEKRGKTKGKIC